MATAVVRTGGTPNQTTTDIDRAQLVIRNPRFDDGATFLNNTGGELVLEEGRILSRDPATEKLEVIDTAAVDGTEFPVGLFFGATQTIADAAEITNVTLLVGGEVRKSAIVDVTGNPALSTVIKLKTLADRLQSDTVGLVLHDVTELAKFDN